MRFFLKAGFLLLLTAPWSRAALTISDDITADATWTSDDSPVTVTKADFTVNAGATLTIGENVTVNFLPASGGVTINGGLELMSGATIRSAQTVKISVYGRITATGSSDQPVVFDEYDDGGWDGFYFRKDSLVHQSRFLHTRFLNLRRDIAVTEQHVSFDSCAFVAGDYDADHFIRTWGGFTNDGTARLRVTNCSLQVSVLKDCSGFGCDRNLILTDGMNAVIENNVMAFSSTGANLEAVNGVSGYTSNTAPCTVAVRNNRIDVSSTSGFVLCYVNGVSFSEYTVTGTVADNDVSLNTAMNAHGIYSYAGTRVDGNTVRITKTASGNGTIYGIYDLNTADHDADKITRNRIFLSAVSDSVSHYHFTGIYMQTGAATNNAVSIAYRNPAAPVRIRGIEQWYYRGRMDNNTIRIAHTGTDDNVTALSLETHYNDTDTIFIRNNILVGSGVDSSTGIHISTGCAATVSGSYNLLTGFFLPHDGMTPGMGLVTDAPLFADSTLRLAVGSPGIDAGDPVMEYGLEPEPNGGRINMGAYGNTPLAALSVATAYPVVVSADPPSGGTSMGAGSYAYNDTVSLAAIPAAGYSFTGWVRDSAVVSTDSLYTFTVTETCTVTVRFSPISHVSGESVPEATLTQPWITGNRLYIPAMPGRITVSDARGKPVLLPGMADKDAWYDVSGWPTGIYILSIQYGGKTKTVRLVKPGK